MTEILQDAAPEALNVDPAELRKFSELASRWWDPTSEFRPLHEINPLRLSWIESKAPLVGRRVLDVGCGGGILSESMARAGAQVRGIDLADKSLKVAQLHSLESGVSVQYQNIAVESLAARQPGHYEVVTCMEMLEHVPDPEAVVRACAELAAPGAWLFFSTLNRNLKSFLMAIVGAEYLLRLLPRGTHSYERMIKPSELARWLRGAQLDLVDLVGMSYNPVTQTYALARDTDVNYLIAARKPLTKLETSA